MRALILLTTLLLFSTIAFAQKGTIEGKITDAHNGLPLSGVSVVDKNTGKGVISNSDGRYIIHTVGKTISLIFSYDGVTQQVDEIEIEDGKVTTQNLVITPKTKTEEVVVVRASSNARKESAAALLSFQKNTNTVASVISSETIKRSPDKNTGEVLKRIPGAS
ncbi:MAG TPA: carboxypeptidase-like regulatory domain-containing protein, partial [Ferruginibacter sp.]|nr:carboxypeptidase-like regulatory domain-containing protein [Ferruginibacter sp.]